MNRRQKELLRLLLLQGEGVLHINDLADELGCAEKTVRNDLDRLAEFLEEYPSAQLIRKPGIGISIEIDGHDRTEIIRLLLSSDPKTVEERLFEMAFQLLTSQKGITVQYWADRYYMPKASIKKDLETITNWLERYELQLVSKQRVGNLVEGSELKKRNALAHLSELITSSKNVVLDLFLPYEVTAVRKALKEMQKKFSVSFTDEAIESLLIHALVMIKRTRQKSPVFVQDEERERAIKWKEYQYATSFFDELEMVFQLKFPEVERVYFTWHLISGKRLAEGNLEKHHQATVEMIQVLIGKMSKLTLFPFNDDLILANGLTVHMHSVINRLGFGFPITNPLLSNIKRMYPYMFSMVMLSIEEINHHFQMEIPEDEAAYIVLHFQASIERLEGRQKVEKKKAVIVCHMGIGMSHLLEAKIEQQYKEIDILACIGKAELPQFIQQNHVDFIISTVSIEKMYAETIVISPLFSQDDKQKLSQFVKNIEENKIRKKDYRVVIPLMKEEFVFFNVDKFHRYEVVEMLGMALYKKGYVEYEFIHSAVNRERKSGTAIGGGIAIPHGDPSLIKKPVVAVAILKEPLEWGDESASVIFMLALTKENQTDLREVIGRISSLSELPNVVHLLTETNDYREFVQVLDSYF